MRKLFDNLPFRLLLGQNTCRKQVGQILRDPFIQILYDLRSEEHTSELQSPQ